MPRKKYWETTRAIDLLKMYGEKRLKADYKEYLYRKANRMSNRWLYFGLAFKNKKDIRVFEKVLKKRGGEIWCIS